MSWKPVTQLIRVRYLIKDNLHDWVCHEVIITTSSDKEISLQELLELLHDHLVPSLFVILLLLTLRVCTVGAFELLLRVEAIIFTNPLLREILFLKSFGGLELAHGFEVDVCLVIEEELI